LDESCVSLGTAAREIRRGLFPKGEKVHDAGYSQGKRASYGQVASQIQETTKNRGGSVRMQKKRGDEGPGGRVKKNHMGQP